MIQRGVLTSLSVLAVAIPLAVPVCAQVRVDLSKAKEGTKNFNAFTSIPTDNAIRTVVEGSSFILEEGGKTEWIPPAVRIVDYPAGGVSLGQGWDSLNEMKAPGECIVFLPEETGGQRARVETRRVFDTDSLRKAMELSTTVSAKAKFKIGGGSVSSKYDFVSSSEVVNQHINLLVKGSIINGVTFVSPSKTANGFIELTKPAEALMHGSENDEIKRSNFLRRCGDSFVAAIERGAELYALYQFSDEARDEKHTATSHFGADASYLAFSGSASTSSKKTLETAHRNQVSGLRYMHSAHRGLRLPYSEETINAALASLGSAPEASDAHPYRVTLVRYDSLPSWTSGPLRSGPATRDALVALHFRLTDLHSAVRNMQRNPEHYELSQGADIEALALLPQVIRAELSKINALLDDCEKAKETSAVESQKVVILDKCSPRLGDAGFSDYPIRMLLPVAKSQIVPVMTRAESQARQSEINKLRRTFNSTHVIFRLSGSSISPPHRPTETVLDVLCPKIPKAEKCARILRDITRLEEELKLFNDKSLFLNIAESRYRYWIRDIADAREDEGALIGTLTESERAMFRREIFCQYGKSPDSAPCPNPSLTELVLDGDIIKQSKEMDFDVTGNEKPTPEEAYEDAHSLMITKIAKLVGPVPHNFEILEQVVSATGNTVGPNKFSMKGKARISWYSSDASATNELLLSPR